MFSKLINKCIRAYQLFISPLFGEHCRYYPSCSEYTRQAIEQHGFLAGIRLGAWRILRCNPFSLGGVDHVPGNCEHSQTTQNPHQTSS